MILGVTLQIQAAKQAEKARIARNRDGVVQTDFCTIENKLPDPTKVKTDPLKSVKVVVEVGPECVTRNPKPETRNPKPETRNPKPDTRNTTPYTLHPTPDTRHPTPYTLHPSPDTRHPTPFTLHPTP